MLPGAALLAAGALAAPPAPRRVGTERQLFFDTLDLASLSNASVKLHRPTIHGPPESFVLEPETLWEGGRFNYYHSVVDNGTHVLLYYDSLTSDGPVKDDIQVRVTPPHSTPPHRRSHRAAPHLAARDVAGGLGGWHPLHPPEPRQRRLQRLAREQHHLAALQNQPLTGHRVSR